MYSVDEGLRCYQQKEYCRNQNDEKGLHHHLRYALAKANDIVEQLFDCTKQSARTNEHPDDRYEKGVKHPADASKTRPLIPLLDPV